MKRLAKLNPRNWTAKHWKIAVTVGIVVSAVLPLLAAHYVMHAVALSIATNLVWVWEV